MKKLLSIHWFFLTLSFLLGHQGTSSCLEALNAAQCPDFTVVETKLPSDPTQLRETTSNQSAIFKAAIACVPVPESPGQCQDKILVERSDTGQVIELQSECLLPWRPFSNLVWKQQEILVFDQWINPGFGYRYAVNVSEGKLIEVSPLTASQP